MLYWIFVLDFFTSGFFNVKIQYIMVCETWDWQLKSYSSSFTKVVHSVFRIVMKVQQSWRGEYWVAALCTRDS